MILISLRIVILKLPLQKLWWPDVRFSQQLGFQFNWIWLVWAYHSPVLPHRSCRPRCCYQGDSVFWIRAGA